MSYIERYWIKFSTGKWSSRISVKNTCPNWWVWRMGWP